MTPDDDPRLRSFAALLDVIDRLRGEGGCPWDRSQALEQLAPCVLEEAYEVADAMLAGDRSEVAVELGDLLMNVLLAARIAQDGGAFSLKEVAEAITDKLIRRHPHVFGETEVADADEVLRNWEQIKKEERSGERDESALAGVPTSLPALLRAYRMGEKAAQLGFEWPEVDGALDKLDEEVEELKEAAESGDSRLIEEELGDVLFSVVNVARHVRVEPEGALRRAGTRFEERFRYVERELGRPMKEAPLAEMEALWRQAKQAGRPGADRLPAGAPDDWRRAVCRMQEIREELLDLVLDLPPDVAVRTPPPEVSHWTVANVLEHLARAEAATVKGLTRTVEAHDLSTLPSFPPEGLAAHPPRNRIVLPEGRVDAPSFSRDDWGLDREGGVVALRRSRDDLFDLLPRLVLVNPRALLLPHPILGELDVLQWFVFTGEHERVHIGQARRIAKALA